MYCFTFKIHTHCFDRKVGTLDYTEFPLFTDLFVCLRFFCVTKIIGSRAVDGKRFLESNASSILGTLT